MAHRNHRRQDQALGKVLRRDMAMCLRMEKKHVAASLESFKVFIGFEEARKQVRVWFRSTGLQQELQHHAQEV